jgi:hypothetical protein
MADRQDRDAPDARDEWQAGWQSHRHRQLTSGLAATAAERLAWLEEAIALAWMTGALPRPSRGDAPG